MSSFQSLSQELIDGIASAVRDASPRLVVAVVFLVVAAVFVRLAVGRVSGSLDGIAGNPAERRFLEAVLRVVLWFGSSLVALSLLGFQQLATALGTASGSLALAVAYALRDALSEVIAGVYLVRDDRFVQGRRVSTDDRTGTIQQVGLRRTTLRDEENGEVIVIANNRIEPRWTLHDEP